MASYLPTSLARAVNARTASGIIGATALRSLATPAPPPRAARYSSSSSSSSSPSPPQPRHPVAFAFDIDGVLKQGPKVLPQALRALRILHGENKYRVKVPYILVTNGGGPSERERAQKLTNELQVDIQPEQVLQAHTVLQSLTRLYGDEPVLVIGGSDRPAGTTRSVMREYGFNNVHTCYDLQAWAPASWPFDTVPEEQRPLVRSDVDYSRVKFKAVIVYHDSLDWGRDIQLMTDILRSKDGVFGTLAEDEELKAREQIPLYFSHNDFLWGNDFPVSRFGQGAFRVAFSSVWQRLTQLPLEYTVFGKPERMTYEYAAEMLKNQLRGSDADRAAEMNVWMIGDNPASDIRGGRDFGWKTALVRTGVYRDALGDPQYRPTILVDDVEAAVRKSLEAEWGPGAADLP
ncbi:unnamed protein product [Parajaminaea phylloscopi]